MSELAAQEMMPSLIPGACCNAGQDSNVLSPKSDAFLLQADIGIAEQSSESDRHYQATLRGAGEPVLSKDSAAQQSPPT